jgi:DNA polymerase-3 subunit gamma/tau
MVRFLRNTVVAKVAGSDSPVLQISSDERKRVARVAERFSEEDLTRFLQIMLRTHSDLGYKQEQRFHLELGLLKLVHAQRLLPLEQLLSGEEAKAGATASRGSSASSGGALAGGTRDEAAKRSTAVAETSPPRGTQSPFKGPSPFEADRNRKSEPKAEASPFTGSLSGGIGSAFPEAKTIAASQPEPVTMTATAVALEEQPVDLAVEVTPDAARNAVLAALEDAGQNMLAHNLESGEWTVRNLEVSVKVAMSQVMVDVALGDAPKRIAHEALAKASGKAMKFKLVSGGSQFTAKAAPPSARPTNGTGARSRAMSDPVVQRMQEKFGAEIRSVIDYKERG